MRLCVANLQNCPNCRQHAGFVTKPVCSVSKQRHHQSAVGGSLHELPKFPKCQRFVYLVVRVTSKLLPIVLINTFPNTFRSDLLQ